jgi:MoaA/NifB/PqqE/SkfB family radical SAM enzyme
MNFYPNPDGGKKEELLIVNGISLRLARLGIALTIIRIAFRINYNPFKVFGLLRSLIKERMKIHENAGQHKAVISGHKYYWSVNIPGWPSENFNRFIFNEIQRIINPGYSNLQTVILAITNLCPLNCIHCYESENISDKNKLSIGDLKLIIENIRNNGINHIHFSGGEPLNRFEDMIELMRFSGNSCEYWINTSGFGLTREKAFIMKQNGMTGAIISLDNWDEEMHNSFRKNNKSFFWVIEAVRNCNEAGILVCLSICPVKEFVTEDNLKQYHSLAKNMGAGFVRIIEPKRVGRFSGKDVLLDEQQIDIIDRFMISRNNDPAFSEYPIIQFPGHHQRKSGCLGAGNRYIYIDSNGDYHSCPFCRRSLGSAMSEPIESGIERARKSGCHFYKQGALI